jgi:hypothetical protein
MSLSSAIIQAESLCKTNSKNYCVVDNKSYNKLNTHNTRNYYGEPSNIEISDDFIILSTDIIKNFPNLSIFYDTITKETSDEKRRAQILEHIYSIGFEASTYNTDLALYKFYSIEGDTFKIRLEMCKNGIITIFIFDRKDDSTMTRSEFFDPFLIKDTVKDFLTIDEKRELMLKKLLK